jgi:hypothetical protein
MAVRPGKGEPAYPAYEDLERRLAEAVVEVDGY